MNRNEFFLLQPVIKLNKILFWSTLVHQKGINNEEFN